MKDHVALIIRNQNKVLFIRRSKYKKFLPHAWAFPTGTKEPNEDLTETARREAQEELNLEVQIEKKLFTKELPEFNDRLHFIVCHIKSGTPKISEPKEFDQIEWLTFQEFFAKYDDSQIGHGLVYLRKNPQIWESYFNQS